MLCDDFMSGYDKTLHALHCTDLVGLFGFHLLVYALALGCIRPTMVGSRFMSVATPSHRWSILSDGPGVSDGGLHTSSGVALSRRAVSSTCSWLRACDVVVLCIYLRYTHATMNGFTILSTPIRFLVWQTIEGWLKGETL